MACVICYPITYLFFLPFLPEPEDAGVGLRGVALYRFAGLGTSCSVGHACLHRTICGAFAYLRGPPFLATRLRFCGAEVRGLHRLLRCRSGCHRLPAIHWTGRRAGILCLCNISGEYLHACAWTHAMPLLRFVPFTVRATSFSYCWVYICPDRYRNGYLVPLWAFRARQFSGGYRAAVRFKPRLYCWAFHPTGSVLFCAHRACIRTNLLFLQHTRHAQFTRANLKAGCHRLPTSCALTPASAVSLPSPLPFSQLGVGNWDLQHLGFRCARLTIKRFPSLSLLASDMRRHFHTCAAHTTWEWLCWLRRGLMFSHCRAATLPTDYPSPGGTWWTPPATLHLLPAYTPHRLYLYHRLPAGICSVQLLPF